MGDLGRDLHGASYPRGVVMRVLGFLALLLLASVFVPAHAACNGTSKLCDSKGEAYDQARHYAQIVVTADPNYYNAGVCFISDTSVSNDVRQVSYGSGRNTSCFTAPNAEWNYLVSGPECPVGSGQVWDAATKDCIAQPCPGGYMQDPWTPGQCLSDQRCKARNDLPAFANSISSARVGTSHCVDGCLYTVGASSVTGAIAGGGSTLAAGSFSFSGAACSSTTLPKEQAETPPEQQCSAAGGGMTFCLKKDGQHCYNATTGKQICWNPKETGEKTDQNLKQKRDAGNTPIAPVLNLPNGDTLVQNGNPVTTNTSTTTNNSTTNTTTTTTNYVTQNGTNASGGSNDGDSGEPGDGSGGDDEGEDDEGETASGGGSCAAPPVCSKPDSIECIQLQVDWQHACDAEQQYGAGFWSSLFGSMTSADDASGDGTTQPGAAGVLGADGQGDLANHREVKMIDGADLDDSGFLGGGSCPQFPAAMAGPITLPIDFTKICDLLGNVGQIVLAVAYFVAIRIIATGGGR